MTAKLPRLVGAFVALAAVGSALSGCGGSSRASAVGATASVSAPVTKAQAAAYAQAVNLRTADVPDMGATSPEHEGKAPGRVDRALARCDGGANPDRLVSKVVSATFTGATEGEHETLKSSVEVEPTVALAALNDAVVLSPRGLACIRRFLPQAFAKEGTGPLRYGPLTVSRLPTPLPGVEGSFGVEIATTVTGTRRIDQRQIHLYVDELGLVSGPAEIGLTAIGGPEPVPPEAEERLLSLLYNRAKAHKL